MLQITIPATEGFDDDKQIFVNVEKECVLQLEHSLISLSKWESKWHVAFLAKGEKTTEQSIDYIRCMTLTQNVNPTVYERLSQENINAVAVYIEEPMTATTFSQQDKVLNKDIITAEIIYYWMIALQVPVEFQKWHLNRLLTLINVCNIKNQPTKNMSTREILARNKALNASRKAALNTRG